MSQKKAAFRRTYGHSYGAARRLYKMTSSFPVRIGSRGKYFHEKKNRRYAVLSGTDPPHFTQTLQNASFLLYIRSVCYELYQGNPKNANRKEILKK